MNWWLVLTHVLVVYAAFGAWLGYTWTREEDGAGVFISLLLGLTLGATIAPMFVVFGDEDEAPIPRPKRRVAVPAEIRQEKKRIKEVERREELSVAVLEMSAGHRKRMAELDERRRAAEEIL